MMRGTRLFAIPRPKRLVAHIQSRLRRLDINPNIVHDVLAQYGASLVASPRNLPNTRRNRNLVVRTSAGEKILKLYRNDWSAATILHEHSILKRLAQLESPSPRLVAAMDGSTYVTIQDQHYALFDFVAGANYISSYMPRSHRLLVTAQAGRILADLHQRLKGFQPEGKHHLGFKSYTQGRHRDLEWHRKKIARLVALSSELENHDDLTQTSWLIQNSQLIFEDLCRLDEILDAISLPRVIIHGDYGLHNILFRDSYNATPVDFELARIEWRLCDLVSCLTKIRYGMGEYDFESINWFMQAYQSVYPLSDEEWQFFPHVWRFYKLMTAVQYWSSYFETGGPLRKLLSARDAIDQSKWASNNPQKLLSLRQGEPVRSGLVTA